MNPKMPVNQLVRVTNRRNRGFISCHPAESFSNRAKMLRRYLRPMGNSEDLEANYIGYGHIVARTDH